MENIHNKDLTSNAKLLRKNMTKEERHLWYDFLKDYSVKFYRQRVIGNYIVDFYCSSAKLVIELDGSQHYEEKYIIYDNNRTKFLSSSGILVIRIPNNEVMKNFSGVCSYIDNVVRHRLNTLT